VRPIPGARQRAVKLKSIVVAKVRGLQSWRRLNHFFRFEEFTKWQPCVSACALIGVYTTHLNTSRITHSSPQPAQFRSAIWPVATGPLSLTLTPSGRWLQRTLAAAGRHHPLSTWNNWARVSILCGMQNGEFRPCVICGISDAEKKLAELGILCSVTKVVVCYLLSKRVATFTIVSYCQQIAEHSAPVIPQSIRGRIPHSVFRIPQSILTHWVLYGLIMWSTPIQWLAVLPVTVRCEVEVWMPILYKPPFGTGSHVFTSDSDLFVFCPTTDVTLSYRHHKTYHS